MAKLSTEIVKRLKKIGLKTEDEKVARKGLLEILKKNGIDGMEDEDTDSLLEMAESFADDEEDEEEEDDTKDSEETDEEEEESDDEEDDTKSDSKDDEEEEDSEEEEKKVETKKSPKKEVKKEKKVITSKKKETEEESDELADEVKEEESTKKNLKKEVKKEKKVVTSKKKRASKKGIKLDFKNNEEVRKYLDPFKKLFDPKKYDYNYVSNAGVTIKHIGKNSKRGVILVENCFLHPDKDNEITCNLYLNLMIKKTDLLEEKGIDFKPCWNDTPMIKDITFDEAIEIVKSLWDDMSNIINGIDNRLGENRKKMEKALDKDTKESHKEISKPNLKKISKKGKK